jgi:hypothetical protein
MNHNSFDELSKALGAAKTRRDLLRAFVAGVVGAVVAGNIPAQTGAQSAQQCTTNADCLQPQVCANGACVTPSADGTSSTGAQSAQQCTTNADCPQPQVCANGTCVAPSAAGTVAAGAGSNAGGIECGGSGQPCCGGFLGPTCGFPWTCVGGTCSFCTPGFVCGSVCCDAFQTCCGDQCCRGMCINGLCRNDCGGWGIDCCPGRLCRPGMHCRPFCLLGCASEDACAPP